MNWSYMILVSCWRILSGCWEEYIDNRGKCEIIRECISTILHGPNITMIIELFLIWNNCFFALVLIFPEKWNTFFQKHNESSDRDFKDEKRCCFHLEINKVIYYIAAKSVYLFDIIWWLIIFLWKKKRIWCIFLIFYLQYLAKFLLTQ